jgi:hypothetical protein
MPLFTRRALATAAALLVASPLAHAGVGQQGYKACKVGGICKPGVPVGFFPNSMGPWSRTASSSTRVSDHVGCWEWGWGLMDGWTHDHVRELATRSHRSLLLSLSVSHLLPVDGWDVYAQRVKLNGQSIVAGFPTPTDPTTPPNCPCTYVHVHGSNTTI